MKLKNVLIAVKDIERAKRFYHDLFGLETVLDNDGNVILTEGLVLQDEKIWKEFLGRNVLPGNNASELYFEEKDLDGFVRKLESLYPDVSYVNRLMTHSWGQRVVRFYDPDGNLIEVGTPMEQTWQLPVLHKTTFRTLHYQASDPEGILLDILQEEPEGSADSFPLLLILHGLTGYKEEAHLAALARMAAGNGFASLRADLYGHGASGGSFRDHTLRKWIAEIQKLVCDAKTLGRYSRIFLCGHSQGALCALLAAATCPDKIDGVIALAPALRIPDQAREGTLFGLHFDPGNVPAEVTVWEKTVSGSYIRDAQSVRAEDAAAYEGPVLFVHSDTDERVPAAVSQEAARQFKNTQLVITHGDTHDFDLHPEDMTDAVQSWLFRQILE